ncbi:MAG: hypothetical protein ACK4PN_04035 [Allorhizobium sp.]
MMKSRSMLVLIVALVLLGFLLSFFMTAPEGNMQRGEDDANPPPHAIQQ